MAFRLPIADSTPDLAQPPPSLALEVTGELLRVGDLAQRTHKTVRALHLYEELGLLHPAERTKGNFRLYGADAEVRVRWISKLQDMGFSLPDIKELLHQWERSRSASNAMSHIRALYRQKLEETERQVRRLSELRRELESSVAYLETCEVCEPARLISSCPQCDLHGCGAPELVAGLHGPSHAHETTESR
jgi:MerR family transcriptional regulator, copper efflux regulator